MNIPAAASALRKRRLKEDPSTIKGVGGSNGIRS